MHYRMLTYIIHLYQQLSLIALRDHFHADKESLAVVLEAFSPVILNPGPPLRNVEIYHTSL
ncbi:hypothetical protein BDR03DRAFT_943789 [Suillus americanus]|nr:hypothetical protein BDR03DRAFT_943789 [Suillus americanus]